MADDGSDILMRIVKSDGNPLLAECQTEVDTDDDKFVFDYFNGEFFEVSGFSFSMALSDGSAPKNDALNSATSGHTGGLHGVSGAPPGFGRNGAPAQAAAQQQGKAGGQFSRWKLATPDEVRKMNRFPVTMQPINITRTYDKASPALFQHVCDSASFASASLVKRKVTGDAMLRGFLRLEFSDVLVKHVTWTNGEVLKEKFTFVYREIKVRYRATIMRQGSTEPVFDELGTEKWNYEAELANRKLFL